jgi:hypothetical protein
MTNQRSAKWIGGLAAIGLLARAVVASAGVADTPLPNFPASSPAGCAAGCPALAVYYAFGAIKNNGVETDFICTNTTTSIQNIALEVFDETGALRNDIATIGQFLNVPVGATKTVATGGTAILHEDQTLSLNLAGSGLPTLRNGSARIVSTSTSIACMALLVDKFHIIVDPALSGTCRLGTNPGTVCTSGGGECLGGGFCSAEQAAPTIANLPLFKLP